jgi:hypothetical protein
MVRSYKLIELGCSREYGNFDRVNTMWLWIELYWFIAMPIGILAGLFLFFT